MNILKICTTCEGIVLLDDVMVNKAQKIIDDINAGGVY